MIFRTIFWRNCRGADGPSAYPKAVDRPVEFLTRSSQRPRSFFDRINMIYKILRHFDIARIWCGKMLSVVSDTEVDVPDTKESMSRPAALITEDGEAEAGREVW